MDKFPETHNLARLILTKNGIDNDQGDLKNIFEVSQRKEYKVG